MSRTSDQRKPRAEKKLREVRAELEAAQQENTRLLQEQADAEGAFTEQREETVRAWAAFDQEKEKNTRLTDALAQRGPLMDAEGRVVESPAVVALRAENTRQRETNDALRAENTRLLTALRWCGGSNDFAPGGTARAGWVRLVAPLLPGWPRCPFDASKPGCNDAVCPVPPSCEADCATSDKQALRKPEQVACPRCPPAGTCAACGAHWPFEVSHA